MATWKKVIVSGSSAHLAGITSSVLTNTNLLIANAGGAIANSGLTLSGNTLALGSNSITSTGANSVLTGSFAGTFSGSLTVNLQDLTQGAGITAFTYDGNATATVAVSGASALSTNRVTKWTGAAFADTTITDNGSIITTTTPLSVGGAITASAISSSGTISGSTLFTPGFVYANTVFPVGSSPVLGDNTSTTEAGRWDIEGRTLELVSNTADWPLIVYTGSIGLGNEIFKIRRDTRRVAINLSNASALNYGLQVEDTFFARASTISQSLTVIGPISASGNISGSSLFITGDTSVGGNVTLGDASADSVTVNAQTLTLANQLAVGALSSTMLVITSSNRVATQTLGTGVATFLNTPSSANLAAAVTDETGTGTLVFSASPTFTGAVTASIISASSGITGSLFGTASSATNALTASNIFPAITNNTDNRVLTATGGGTINGEANLTFDGSTLTNSGTTTLTGLLTANGAITTTNITASAISASGNISGSTLHITSTGRITGNTTLGGTLDVTGNTTLTGDIAVNGGDITTTATTFNLVNGTATTVNFAGGASTALNIGNASGTTTFASNVVFNKDITVIGTASFQETTNLAVADRFILLASGSGTSPSGDGGIVIQQTGSQGVGEAFGWDATNTSRWGITSSFSANQAGFTPDAFMAAVVTAASTTPSPATRYNAVGNIYVSSGDESIWIYS